MAETSYLVGRKQYARPQGLLFADNPGSRTEEGFLIPDGFEKGVTDQAASNFLILSDNNRGPISMEKERIENRKRTINGSMRSYHVADKVTISTSWQLLPSRSFSTDPDFDETTGASNSQIVKHTTDGGAGGADILEWYESNKGSFWVYLAYDKYDEFSATADKYSNLDKYAQSVEVFFSSFSYSVERRGATNFDFWNISLSLEEV
jgi:hypothetical protein